MPRHTNSFELKTTVRTAAVLGSQDFIAPRGNKSARSPNSPGVIVGILGTQNYLVQHEVDLLPGIYHEGELALEPNAYWRVAHSVQGVPYFKEIATHVEVTDYLEDLESGVTATVTGPFYSDKELEEGVEPTQDLFEHLTNDV